MANAMRIRTKRMDDVTAITTIISHPMETGLRKDGQGKPIPAHFIELLTVDVGGRRVVESRLNTSVSTNPVLNFKVKGARAGDKVVVNWTDNLGNTGVGETTIAD